MLGLIVFTAIILVLGAMRKGDSKYRVMFDLGVWGGLAILFCLPLAVSRAIFNSGWFLPVALLYYLGLLAVSVIYMNNRGRFYAWVIKLFR